MTSGRLITLEGGEGVGKSTLATRLQAALENAGLRVIRTREPGGSPGADEIRVLIVTGVGDRWSGLTETLLLTAARSDHLERIIRPALARGDWVVCDRFVDSTYAYQVAARGLPRAAFDALNAVLDPPIPDLTLVLDLDVKVGLARALGRAGGEARFEGFDQAFHDRVRRAFLEISAHEPQRCAVIDASAPADEVMRTAADLIKHRLGVVL